MGAPKILVVDDATTIRMFFRALFKGVGCEVVEARDGNEGLEVALEARPDMAFVDINMPGLDGYSMVRRLRREPILASLPVVMCSTESKPIDELHAYQAGANFYVRKPVPKALVLNIAAILGGGS